MKYRLFILIFILAGFGFLKAQNIIPLYDGKAPGSENWDWEQKELFIEKINLKSIYNVVNPVLIEYLPSATNNMGTAVIIAPGGAMNFLGVDHEAADVAKWLNSKGITAFVLRYRLNHLVSDDPFKESMEMTMDKQLWNSKSKVTIPLAVADGLKAIEYVRNNADKYNISPKRVGMIGFSAGGIVTFGAAFSQIAEKRPDFIASIYSTHKSLEEPKIPKNATPLFMTIANDDVHGFATDNTELYNEWQKVGNKNATLHIYEKGGHGFGLKKQNLPTDSWTERFEEWLDQHGWLWPINPKGFYAAFTPEQAKKLRKDEADRLKTDWAFTKRYAEENNKLPAPKADEKRVVFLGSSRIENWKKYSPDFFTANPNYLNRGVSGQTSPQMLLRFRDDVINLKPAAVVFSGGSNDIAQNTGPTTLEAIASNVEAMILLAKANNIKFIMCSEMPTNSYPWNPNIQPADQIVELNKLYKGLAIKYKLPFVDTYTSLVDEQKGLKKEYQQDPVHPNKIGYLVLEPIVQKAIKSTLK
jgi:lysophospholipase L1-like esterase/dienelactone hydrolase